ncbi:bifunctional DNA primase/polymerase [Microcoleus sp. D3_18_C4]|uniref:bifunctional DNA primase/polymerase n=1 Tax=Microcoleus sp. D3_18_C4 TaxID=3055335 RepID=UPI002FD38004
MNSNSLSYQVSSEIPCIWPLVPVFGKRPYHKRWVDKSFHRLGILAELQTGKASGIGLKLGAGLLAVDFDGDSALQLLSKLAGENNLNIFYQTTSWSSGRPGRKQCLFSVDEKDWGRLRNLRIATGILGEDGTEEFLEFRWLGSQSVIPPSIHPSTGLPYQWLNSPLQTPPALAPEWLINLCEGWHSEFAGLDELDLVRFPVRLFPYFGRQMSLWLLARRFDISRWEHSGKSKGCGIGKFSLQAASLILKRSPGHLRKLLSAAKTSGLIRYYKQRGAWITVCYSSLEKAIALSGIDKLGPVASINIDSLKNIHLIATEVETQNLQRLSFHLQRREEIEQIKPGEPSGLYTPTQIMAASALHPCEKLARVLEKRSERFIFCKSDFRFYGGSQETIAQLRGLSPGTISRHLSNSYRLVASPVHKFREDLPPISKKQLLEQLSHLQKMPANFCREDGLIFLKGDWYKPHPNIYLLNHRLVSVRRRRLAISKSRTGGAGIHKEKLLISKISPGDLENKVSLSKLLGEDSIKKENSSKKPGQGKSKMIIAQQ